MIAPDVRSSDDIKVAVLKNDKGEWHIVDDSLARSRTHLRKKKH